MDASVGVTNKRRGKKRWEHEVQQLRKKAQKTRGGISHFCPRQQYREVGTGK